MNALEMQHALLKEPLKPWRIVIMRLSALGDATLIVPLVRTLQQRFPNAKITWVIGKAAYELLKGLSGVEFIVIKKPESLRDYFELRGLLKKHSYDVLLALQASLRTNLLYPALKASLKVGFDKKRARDGQRYFVNAHIPAAENHLLEGFLQFAEYLGATEPCLQWELPIGAAEINWAQQQLSGSQRILAVNPAASKLERTWFADRYASVIERAQQLWGVSVVLTGGSSREEQQLAAEIEQHLTLPVINLVGKTTLKQLAAVLAMADVMLTPDSGPAHIAVAMGTPVVGLYAVAPPALSAPYLSKEHVVDRFPQAVQHILGKDPATVPWGTRVHHRRAMALIDVDSVIQALTPLFEVRA
jgi:heptosyltransferase I